ncbi:unnamed protein product [Symbiodinium natans]|uniref:Uncharacterized protein n=1 Tax=Symbiodinium natans TaxID=878477 RepID=A0A812M7U0_9DINO|nr:unnamed protein product [Symbiodinium natans]
MQIDHLRMTSFLQNLGCNTLPVLALEKTMGLQILEQLACARRFVGYMMAFGISFEQGRNSVTSTLRKSHAFLGQQTVQLYAQLLLSAYEVATPQGTAPGPGELNLAVLEAESQVLARVVKSK